MTTGTSTPSSTPAARVRPAQAALRFAARARGEGEGGGARWRGEQENGGCGGGWRQGGFEGEQRVIRQEEARGR